MEALKEAMRIIEALPDKKNCKNCTHFDQGFCKISDGAKPPAHIVEAGCNMWQWDEVPF